jgi:DNA-binding transcriptional ArsR family regulator
MRRELGDAVVALFERPLAEPERDGRDAGRLLNLAALVVRCRSAVERDGYTREVELIPAAEAPTRLVVVLDRLLAGLLALGADAHTAWSVVGTAALDSIPALRRAVMDGLAAAEGELATAKVAENIGYPKSTTERALDDLVAHGVVVVNRHGQGRATTWQLAEWAAEGYAEATSPEMSGHLDPTSPEMSGGQSLSLCTHTRDKSGEVGGAADASANHPSGGAVNTEAASSDLGEHDALRRRVRAIAAMTDEQAEQAWAEQEAIGTTEGGAGAGVS